MGRVLIVIIILCCTQNQSSPDPGQSNQQENGIQNHQLQQSREQAQQTQQQLQVQNSQSLQQSLQQSQGQSLQQSLQQNQQQTLQQHQQQQYHISEELQQQAQQQALLSQAPKGTMPHILPYNKPRSRMTAYAFFVKTYREEHKKKHPDENIMFAAFSKKCAERWMTMNENEKQRFHEMAEQDKQRYELEMQSYAGRGGRRNVVSPNAPKRAL